jgi:hypothetical protein
VALLVIAAGVGFVALSGGGGSSVPTQSPGPTFSLTIVIAGTEYVVGSEEISYEELYSLAFGDQTPAPGVVISFSYRRGPPEDPRGILGAGESVKVRDGMTFAIGAVA